MSEPQRSSNPSSSIPSTTNEYRALANLNGQLPRLLRAERLIEALIMPEDGFVELRAILDGTRRQAFFPRDASTGGVREFMDSHRSMHLYLGIAGRRDTSSGKLENCTRLRALFVDIDFKTFSDGEREAREALDTFPLPPSVVIGTGGGLHAYWLLTEPLDLVTAQGQADAKALLRALATAVRGDLQSAEPARCLRLPGTRNWKYDPPRLVAAEHFAPACRYPLATLREHLPERVEPAPSARTFSVPAGAIPAGHRNDTLYRVARGLIAKGLHPEAVIAAVLAQNQAMCEPPLPQAEVVTIVSGALTQPNRPGFSASSYDADGRVPDPERDPIAANQSDDPAAVRLTEAVLDEKLALLSYEDMGGLVVEADNKREATDVGFAGLLVRWWGDDLRLAPQETSARWWTGTYWAEDIARGRRWQLGVLSLRLLAHAPQVVPIPDKVLADMVTIARKRWQDKQTEAEEKGKKAVLIPSDDALAAEAAKNIRTNLHEIVLAVQEKFLDRYHLLAALASASEQPPIRVHVNDYDGDPWLLGCANGTLDLRTGKFREADPADLITRIIPVAYDPTARCPSWQVFLDRIFAGDHALTSFMQRSLGYTLTGDTSEQVFWVLWGTGANGKTTLLSVMYALLGGYAVHTRAETILVKRNSDAIPTDVAALHRARFVYAVEPNRGARLDEALIKAATGGDPLTARFMRRDFFTFIPRFKLFLATNSKPRIVGVDHGIWRRVMLVPFTVTIPAEAQDKSLLSKLVQELPGILNWALEGERERRRLGGLRPPEIVLAATRRYRREQDRLGEWLGDSIFARGTDQDFVSTEDLYDDYQRWCAKSGEQHPMSKRALGDALEERGCPRDRRGNLRTRGHVGIKIADERDPVGGGW